MKALWTFGLERMMQLTGEDCKTTLNDQCVEFKGILDQESQLVQDDRGVNFIEHMFRLTVLRDIALQIPRDVLHTIVIGNTRYTVRHILLRGDGENCEIYLATPTPLQTPCEETEQGC